MEFLVRVSVLSLGGILGVNARYWLGVLISRWAASHWATMAINVSGSFAIGFLSMALARWLPHPHARLAILTGFLGGYTTFSTFAFESVTLWERGEPATAMANVAGSVVLGVLAAFLGIVLARDVLIAAAGSPTAGMSPAKVTIPTEELRLAMQTEGSPDLELPPDILANGMGVDAAEEAEGRRA
ncbi:camphor resistance protein CrcB [Aquisphaera giovannonii]|uniref:Fluoride-specific ion channel FluC n=1 Tax=Aquisphaera giovannonii TaxID=406548 RepID=A0A5B9W2L7_9BACT|nr:fluoride efflux transporter CrcB [Aquisphaera giovannonii]QEH34539.1 camphor resistance protein CrcB [Aquisphaera giovannonii]